MLRKGKNRNFQIEYINEIEKKFSFSSILTQMVYKQKKQLENVRTKLTNNERENSNNFAGLAQRGQKGITCSFSCDQFLESHKKIS